MKKAVFAAATAALLAGSAIAYAAGPVDPAPVRIAQATPAPSATTPATAAPAAPAGRQAERQAERQERAQRRFDADFAALKDALKLTPDQQKLWPAFETAVRDAAQQRWSHMAERRANRPAAGAERPDPVTRMRTAAERMTANAANLTKVADALSPLYQSLDATQKAAFEETARNELRGFLGMPHGPRGERPRRG